MLGRVAKIEKKEPYFGACDCLENKEPSTFTGRLWNSVITSRHKMEMKYSDRGALVQRRHLIGDRRQANIDLQLHPNLFSQSTVFCA